MTETILQFGAGRFLRAFADRFIHQANEAGQDVGKVVVVQTTPGKRAEILQKSTSYHVLVRGIENGERIDRAEPVHSLSRALIATADWPEVLQFAQSPDLKYILSNATEAGYVIDTENQRDAALPATMPAKLTRVLWERFQNDGSPVTLLPCELIENNSTKLRELVVSQALQWNLSDEFQNWIQNDCRWLNTLVDSIVTSPPEDHPLAQEDPGLVQSEPFIFWGIERIENMPTLFTHPAIQIVDDLTPYYLRKVRILNGLHTAMTAKYLPAGFETVKQVLEDEAAAKWLNDLLWEEIVPTIAQRVEGAEEFARITLDRFRNPFLEHKLQDIALNHEAKLKVRLEPTRNEYRKLFNREPKHLNEVLTD